MTFIGDGLRSLLGRLGDPTRDKGAGLSFVRPVADDEQLAAAYAGNWAARKVVDIPAKDALREWRRWHGDEHEAITAEEHRLRLRAKVLEAQIMARLYGGAALYLGTGQESGEELDVEAVQPGGLGYVTVLTRREIEAGEIETDPLSEHYGHPRDYLIGAADGRQVAVHPSHLALFRGDERPDRRSAYGRERGWDQSVLYAVASAIKEFSGSTANVSSLLFEANIDVIGVPELARKMAQPGGEDAIVARFALASANKSINGSMILDGEETYQRKSASFSDLTPMLESFALFVAAGADIPATRFLARSPTGLNATGGHDQSNYFDKLRAMQTLQIGPAMERLDACLVRSAGVDPETRYDWAPLERENPKELAEIGKATAETLAILADLGLTRGETRELTIHRLTELGVFPHLEQLAEETRLAGELDPPEDEDEDDS